MNTVKSVSILGCGWLGLALAKALRAQGFSVKGSATSQAKCQLLAEAGIEPFELQFSTRVQQYPELAVFLQSDVLLVAVSPGKTLEEKADYEFLIDVLCNELKKNPVKQVIFLSSTAVYGEENGVVTELSIPNPNTVNGTLLVALEAKLQALDANVCLVRLAGLVGPDRHPGRFFAGRKAIENGEAPVNLIHQLDAIGVLIAIIKTAYAGCINAVAPSHPTRAQFYTAASAHAGLSLPEFTLEKKQWKVVQSVHLSEVYPHFSFPDLLSLYTA